jgi:hypothetical protein
MEDLTTFILKEKFEFLRLVGNISMLWWVSTVVFCGTIVGASIAWKKELFQKFSKKKILGLWALIFIFFCSTIYYGYLTVLYAYNSKNEVFKLLKEKNISNSLFQPEFELLYKGVICGSSSFAIIFLGWFFLGIWLYKEYKEIDDKSV